jgi:hypothetical protein
MSIKQFFWIDFYLVFVFRCNEYQSLGKKKREAGFPFFEVIRMEGIVKCGRDSLRTHCERKKKPNQVLDKLSSATL